MNDSTSNRLSDLFTPSRLMSKPALIVFVGSCFASPIILFTTD